MMNRTEEVSKLVQTVNNSLFAAKMDNILQYIYEKDLKKEVSSIFKDMKLQIINNLKEYYSTEALLQAHLDLILAPIHEAHKAYYDVIMKYKLREYKKGQVQGKRLVTRAKQYAKDYSKAYVKQNGALKADEMKFSIHQVINQKDVLFGTSEYSADHMKDKTFVASQKTLARVDSDINEIITEGYKDGKGINDVTKRINKRFRQLESWESQRIARTEIHGSHMLGIMQSYQDMNVQYTQWASAHDDRVRGLNAHDKADHVKMDGEIIAWGGTYSNGLKYPGDTSGRIVEWINCRCGNLPWFCPPGYAVPSGMAHFREKDLVKLLDQWESPEDLLAHSLIEDETFVGEYINPNELWLVSDPQSTHVGHYLIDSADGPIIKNMKTGKYTFKGLELDYNDQLDMAYVTHEEIVTHNEKVKKLVKFDSIKEYIDTNELVISGSPIHKGEYLISSSDGQIIKNPKTGKYEFHGLELDGYSPKTDLAYISKKDVDAHNAKLIPSKKYIDTADLYESSYDKGLYLISESDGIIKNPKTGKYEFYGLELDSYDPQKGYTHVPKVDIFTHNAKVQGKSIEKEYIDTGDLFKSTLHKDTYHLEASDGIIKNPKTGKYEFKGLEVDYNPMKDVAYVPFKDVEQHNAELSKGVMADLLGIKPNPKSNIVTPPKEHIQINQLTIGDDPKTFSVDLVFDDLKIVDAKAYYKGLHVKNYDPDLETGTISLDEIKAHNAQLLTDELDKYALTPDQKVKLKKLSENVFELHGSDLDEWEKLDIQNDINTLHNKKLKGNLTTYETKKLDALKKELKKNHGIDLDNVAKKPKDVPEPQGEYIYKSDLVYDDYLKEYKISKSEIKFNPDTHQYEYKGMKIDQDAYINSKHMVYVKGEDIDKHNHALIDNALEKEKTVIGEDDVELTWRDVNELELDPYGDYMIDETHRVKFNDETGQWEYKKVPLFDYDEEEHIGIIDADEMKAYLEEHEIKPPSRYFKSKVLTEEEIQGEKYLVDKDGRKWVIDTDRTYEHYQDTLQNANASSHYTQEQRDTVTHWGQYGHQYISNLIYGNDRYGNWDTYQDLMEEVTPLLNRMKQKYKLVVDETLDNEIRKYAIMEYNELKKIYMNIADNVDDFDVTKTLYEIMDLDAAIISTPKLAQDTCFIRYGHFNEDMCQIGEVFDLKGFLSISYDDATLPPDATSHFADKQDRWRMIILAPEGTEGIRLNSYFNALTSEREWLLPRNMKFEVVDYGTVMDPGVGKRNTVTIRLLPEDEVGRL